MLPLILYITAMRYFSLLSNKVNLYQTMNLKCNNGSLHGLLSSVFNVSMAINRLATNFGQVLPRDVHFYESMENDSLKMQSSIMDMKNKVVGLIGNLGKELRICTNVNIYFVY